MYVSILGDETKFTMENPIVTFKPETADSIKCTLYGDLKPNPYSSLAIYDDLTFNSFSPAYSDLAFNSCPQLVIPGDLTFNSGSSLFAVGTENWSTGLRCQEFGRLRRGFTKRKEYNAVVVSHSRCGIKYYIPALMSELSAKQRRMNKRKAKFYFGAEGQRNTYAEYQRQQRWDKRKARRGIIIERFYV